MDLKYLIRLGSQNQKLTVYTVSTTKFNLPTSSYYTGQLICEL